MYCAVDMLCVHDRLKSGMILSTYKLVITPLQVKITCISTYIQRKKCLKWNQAIMDIPVMQCKLLICMAIYKQLLRNKVVPNVKILIFCGYILFSELLRDESDLSLFNQEVQNSSLNINTSVPHNLTGNTLSALQALSVHIHVTRNINLLTTCLAGLLHVLGDGVMESPTNDASFDIYILISCGRKSNFLQTLFYPLNVLWLTFFLAILEGFLILNLKKFIKIFIRSY